jgi:hypothetical protein
MTKIITEKTLFQEKNRTSGIFLKFLPCVWVVVNLPADVGCGNGVAPAKPNGG